MSSPETPEAVAVIGMAGRFPQAANLREFWQNLRGGRECVSFFKDEEVQWLPIEKKPRLGDPAFVKARAILDRPEWFDAAFFGMNPKEADLTDPQHRVFLECAWEALEDAGVNPEGYPGLIGVFAGASLNTYLFSNVLANRQLGESLGFFPAFIANGNDFLTTRVSYKLNLRGPSVNVQTACSTSLVAVCTAVQNLLGYRCDVALAGGASITFPARRGQYHLEGGIMSHDGHCRAFSAGATGTVLGDGAGVVVLKRLSEALADGDPIRAVIRGSAINNDGSVKMGYTAPSSDGQAEAIALAHAEAGFAPDSISYIEAHGTGTPLGDPIEVEGLTKAFGLKGERGQFCGIGSVKTNIGHLDITAGIAGLIKTVLALEARELPPSLHFEAPNPKIDFKQTPFYVVNAVRPWTAGKYPRRAGVSSFGIGGTNAHVALEEAPAAVPSDPSRAHQLITLSARTPAALEAATDNLAAHLEAHPQLNLADVAATLQRGRKAFAQRRVIVATDTADAVRRLRASAGTASIRAGDTAAPVIFMFPGQGAQHPGMARGLYETESVFKQSVDDCCRLLAGPLGLDLRTLLYPAPAGQEAAARRLDETAITQPALFTTEYSLAKLWMSWGIKPHALIGHSLGEYVAACLAGVFTLPEALALVAARARLMQAQPRGAMLAVRLAEAEAAAFATGPIALAAVNAPELCVLAGPVDAITGLEQKLAARGIGGKRLATSHAFHSPMMEPALAPFLAELRKITLRPPQLPCISNVTGTWLTTAQATDPSYWTTHLRQTVRFADGIGTLLGANTPLLLEVGPGQTLATLARQHAAAPRQPAPLTSLGRGADSSRDARTTHEALGHLWAAGAAVDWNAWHGTSRRQKLPLPTYPFERQRHWFEPAPAGATAAESPATVTGTVIIEAATAPTEPVAMPAESIPEQLRALFGELAGHDFSGANAGRTFHELGLDSLLLTQASYALRDRFGVDVTMRQLIEQYSTLEKLSAHLAASIPAPATQAKTSAQPVPPSTVQSLPLTPAQQEIWYVSQMGPALSAAYNESCTLHLRGRLDEPALRRALGDLAARHEVLRATFSAAGDQQRIAATGEPDLALLDLAAAGYPDSARLKAAVDEAIGETFDLVTGPLWRARVLRIAPDHHALVLVLHHIICDGWSRGVLVHELGELYTARLEGRAPALPAPARFSDYALAETWRQKSPSQVAAEAYWLNRFADGVPVLELPTDRPRPATRTYAADHHGRPLSPATVDAVRRLAARHGSTHFTVLLAGYASLLHRHSGQDDLVVGVPAAPQVLAGQKNLVGHCVNLLPIRSRLAEGQDFASLLQDTRRLTLDAFEHWHHPFARLLHQLNLPRDPNRVPLANVTFNVGRQRGTVRFAGLDMEAASNPKRFVNFDLNFNIVETDGGFLLDCYYTTELFDPATIECLADRYEELLQAAAAAPATPVHRLAFLPAAERQRLLVEWNHTAVNHAPARCLHELFADQAARTPKALAVADEQNQLSYRDLQEASSALAHRLRARGVHAGDRVAVCLEPSVALPIALLAILKTGAAYVPMDAATPVARLNFMVADAGARLVLTQEKLASLFSDPDQILCLDAPADQHSIGSNPPIEACTPGRQAYVIYTSGSTGTPKGVPISHANVANLIAWHRRTYAVTPADRATQLASPAFDACVWELWPYLTSGASVHFPSPENRLSPARLIAWLAATRITMCFLPTPLAEAVMDEPWPADLPLRAILTGGDRLRRWPAGKLPCLLANHYGPTECTVLATAAAVPAEADGSVVPTIGHPIDNLQVYLLDRHLELVPPGVPGELCIAGAGVAQGYLNQPELTREKFVPNPFGKTPGELLYRTGDLARHRADGSIEFLGRLDHQVKIRGYRIELGEIEAALQRLPAVRECVVVAREDTPGEKRLVAYVVPAAGSPAAADLRAALAQDLPAHMLPAAFVCLDRLPLTTNGKIDRRALPAPETSAPAAAPAEAVPRTITEEVLAGIWCDVLHVPSVGLRDNFFELGGHSLLVTQVLARVQQAFHLELPLRHAFEAPTVAELATIIENALVEDIRASADSEPESIHADLAR